MDTNRMDLCGLLTSRLTFLLKHNDPRQYQTIVEKMNATLKNDFVGFHEACEREIQRKNEDIESYRISIEHLIESIKKLIAIHSDDLEHIALLKEIIRNTK